MLPLCCAEMITSSGCVIASTALATSTYFDSPSATEKTSRRAAWTTATTPTAASTATTVGRDGLPVAPAIDATIDAAPIAIIGHAGSRNRRYHQASHGTNSRYDSQ